MRKEGAVILITSTAEEEEEDDTQCFPVATYSNARLCPTS